ncbi:hypothetical protein D9O39_09295 [Riemerella anatipestifer]|nr:hypothetical protein D9O39_09295 [Riemerella anatipestifer]
MICLPQFMQYTINHIQENVKKLQNYLAVPNNFVNTHTHTHTHTHTQLRAYAYYTTFYLNFYR